MINKFRTVFQSKLGLGLMLGFLGLIALAFASADVTSTGMFGGLSGTNDVAVVGDDRITTAELRQSTETALRRVQQEQPTISLVQFIADGGLDEVLDGLMDRVAISEFGKALGLRAGDNLINSEIRMLPSFAGPDGSFSEEVYRAAIGQQGLTDQMVREDLGDGLIAQQVLIPLTFGSGLPPKLVRRYAEQLRERREGTIGQVVSALYVPDEDPTTQQLQAFYRENRDNYIRPERRSVTYAVLGEEALDGSVAATNAEIAERYRQNQAQYRASEERTFTQLIVPTRAAAETFAEQVAGGASLDEVADGAGLETSQIGPIAQADYAQRVSPAVANAVFAADEGDLAEIARSPLGFHVVRIDDVTAIPGRSLADVRSEIAEVITTEKRRRALSELASAIEERIDSGENLRAVAEDLDLDLQTTEPLLRDGRVYDALNEAAPELIRPALQTVFQMEEGRPQLGQVSEGNAFLIFQAEEIFASAAAPLREIQAQVARDWKLAEGMKGARAAADRILKRVEDGQSLSAAIRAENARLPAGRPIDITREQFVSLGRSNPPVALMFNMAPGTAKRLEVPNNEGYFLIELNEIEAGKLEEGDELLEAARGGYGSLVTRELAEQLRDAIRDEVGIELNEEAIAAVRRELTSTN